MASKTGVKRKSQDAVKTSDNGEYEAGQAIDSTKPSHTTDAASASHQQKKTRSVAEKRPKSKRLAQTTTDQNKKLATCSICKMSPLLRARVSNKDMVQCEIKTCGRWYHMICLWEENERHISLSHTTGPDDSPLFICSACVNAPEDNDRECIAEAKVNMTDIINKVRRRLGIEEGAERGFPNIPVSNNTLLQNNNIGHSSHRSGDIPWLNEDEFSFRPAKEEKYRGFETDVIRDLIRKIDQSIFDYNKEVCDLIDNFDNPNGESLQTPLKMWELVDPNAGIVAGQDWYRIEESAMRSGNFNSHAPITSSLRSMVHIAESDPISIASSLHDLTFSQVHTACLSWFVIDILEDNFSLFELPNMKPLRAIMTGVNKFGEARWPKMGKHVLREVQLRTWPRELFRDEVLKNKGVLMSRLKSFTEPLTRRTNPWSDSRADIIESTMRLWSYLRPLEGKFHVIQPKLGSAFDSELQDAYDDMGMPLAIGRSSKKVVRWVTRRGFRYREDNIDGPREMVVKAVVIVR
ncbi:hypothetical protein LOCC1_G000104 [Lachnellula occidentalis]|uniref:PHD-type domain-containing protein n=1 Tax=Lachnellula occidentalis TaxID=215460 RepID=A0A8H8SC27_9HELO|nr:hypothetical protein LOCC1_G000104 [Lachnellula occidentalis]